MQEPGLHLLALDHDRGVHNVHLGTMSSNLSTPLLSAHVVIYDTCFLDGHARGCNSSSMSGDHCDA